MASDLMEPAALTVDDNNVYFATSTAVMGVPIAGGSTRQIAADQAYPSGLAVNAGRLFWTDTGHGRVLSVPTASSEVQVTVVREQQPNQPVRPFAIANDGASLYVTYNDVANGSVLKISPDSGSSDVLVSGLIDPSSIVLSADRMNLYFITINTIMSVSTTVSGSSVVLARPMQSPQDIALDASYVYYLTQDNVNPNNGTIFRIRPDGSSPTTLAMNIVSPQAIAVDAQNIYVSSLGTEAGGFKNGAILRVPLAGGSPMPIATDQESPATIALDKDNIYWVNHVAWTGSVMKMAK